MSTDPLYPSQVFFMMPDSSNNPRHEILGSFSWLDCYNSDFRAVLRAFVRLLALYLRQGPLNWLIFVY